MNKEITDLSKLGLLNLENKILEDMVFYIPSYQRGYRWHSEMVQTLLDDIIACKDNLYCIQPIVVKKMQNTDNTYIVADGQQRLTTLYIIYHTLGIEIPFKFKYETRGEFTGNLLNNKMFEEAMSQQSVDCYFIYNTYEIVKKHSNNDILKNKLKKVYCIWYPLSEGSDNEAQVYFDRLNFGKIKLEDAELVKSLFLLDHSNNTQISISESYKNQIAIEWDIIERKLHNSKFWGFINSINTIKKGVYPVRMGLLLDLYSGVIYDDKHSYSTFLKIEKDLESGVNIKSVWEKINQIFEVLCEWYEDDYLFHYVGFLMSQRNSQSNLLKELLKEWNSSESRDDFKSKLIEKITDVYVNRKESKYQLHIADNAFIKAYKDNIEKGYVSEGDLIELFKDKYSLSELQYGGSNNYLIQDILLLFNILEMKPNNNNENWKSRFRFDLYKQQKEKKQVWSLEHIYAQNKSSNDNLDPIHTIDNMSLLTVGDNASNSDDTFLNKKDNIRALDMQGSFIPQATKNVFLKYYTLSISHEENDFSEWTVDDRKHYFLHLILTLNKFQNEGF